MYNVLLISGWLSTHTQMYPVPAVVRFLILVNLLMEVTSLLPLTDQVASGSVYTNLIQSNGGEQEEES